MHALLTIEGGLNASFEILCGPRTRGGGGRPAHGRVRIGPTHPSYSVQVSRLCVWARER